MSPLRFDCDFHLAHSLLLAALSCPVQRLTWQRSEGDPRPTASEELNPAITIWPRESGIPGHREREHSPVPAKAPRETAHRQAEGEGPCVARGGKEAGPSPVPTPLPRSRTQHCWVQPSQSPALLHLAENLKANPPGSLPVLGVASSTPAHAGRRPGSEDAGQRARAGRRAPAGAWAGQAGARLRSERRLVEAVRVEGSEGRNVVTVAGILPRYFFSKFFLFFPPIWFSPHSSEDRKSECHCTAEWMQALGPLAVGGKNEIICTTCLDMTPATSAHISLARASHVTKPDFKGMGLCNSAV
ncbi:uncharacterized protein LOC123385754 [Felis catus]|uniref:uncharacterized protein LOC123385754 n=1 Tax=Felis catus TaxID=9685 RepID=UPI001D19B543|nr:uncharacterized protein LOC123385754 [Felis catus]